MTLATISTSIAQPSMMTTTQHCKHCIWDVDPLANQLERGVCISKARIFRPNFGAQRRPGTLQWFYSVLLAWDEGLEQFGTCNETSHNKTCHVTIGER
jgi:hypothetical protein